MSTELLERGAVELDENDPVDEGRKELAQKAQRLLGYYQLSHELERNPSTTRGKLLNACKKLGIEPYTKESVAKYKRSVVNAYRWRAIPMLIAEYAPPCLGVTGVASFVVGALWMIGVGIFAHTFAWMGLWILMGGVCSVIAAIAWAGCNDTASLTRFSAEWKKYRINEYNKPIPEFALQSAVSLAEECGRVTFFIEELQVYRHAVGDPFLVAVDSSDEEHYIEVWNEPTFRQDR